MAKTSAMHPRRSRGRARGRHQLRPRASLKDARAADPAGWAALEADLAALVQAKWTAWVAARNPDLVDVDRPDEFLFCARRVSLERIRGPSARPRKGSASTALSR
jgi:hypothetical protein